LNIRYPYKFPTINEAIQFATNNNYGFIVKKNDKIYKISNDAILHKEEVNAYNHNKWYNLLYVYMLQKDNYNIKSSSNIDSYNVIKKYFIEPKITKTSIDELKIKQPQCDILIKLLVILVIIKI
jgi:hypothetical protein